MTTLMTTNTSKHKFTTKKISESRERKDMNGNQERKDMNGPLKRKREKKKKEKKKKDQKEKERKKRKEIDIPCELKNIRNIQFPSTAHRIDS